MNRERFYFCILSILLFQTAVLSQECTTYSCDSLAVRAILDSNGLTSVKVTDITDSAGGRITGIDCENLGKITDEIGNLTGLTSFSCHYKLYYISTAITKLDKLKSIDLTFTRMCTIPVAIQKWAEGRSFDNFAPDCNLPQLTLTGKDTIFVVVGNSYKELGATALQSSDGDLSPRIVIKGTVNTSTAGCYKLTYSVVDNAGNSATKTRIVNVVAEDTEPPVISINGPDSVSIYRSQPYKDQSASATDIVDGDLSNEITATSDLDSSIVGIYHIVYKVADHSGNTAQAQRVITVLPDTVAPSIIMLGNNPLTWQKGIKYVDPGIRVIDPEGGDVTDFLKQLDSVDVQNAGKYQIHFSAFDYAGNHTDFIREVNVVSDIIPPRLELYGDTVIHIALNGSFKDPGYKAFDDELQIDLTDSVKIDGTVDSSQVKEFLLEYSVADSIGNKKSLRRHIFVDSIPVTDRIRFNQVGYLPKAPKIITVDNAGAATFKLYKIPENILIREDSLRTVSGPYIRADISDIEEPGQYQLKIDGLGYSKPITIGYNVYNDLLKATLKAYYYQRCSFELKPEFAGVYSRGAGHPDTSLLFYGFSDRQGKFSSPGGWYDAGDYGKYVVNAGITVGTFLNFYEILPEIVSDNYTNIPESKNKVSDLLDEVKYELDWFNTMQDTDGGVFFKIGPLSWPGFVMPDKDIAQRYVIGKGTASTLNFAAVMAMASRVWRNIDSTFADSCLNRSIRAWQWAKSNPSVQQPSERNGTGDYSDSDFEDEFFWAGTELYITTGDPKYKQNFDVYEWMTEYGHWQRVYNPGVFSVFTHLKDSKRDSLLLKNTLQNITKTGADILKSASSNRFSIPYEDDWGSNADIGNKAILLVYLYRMTGDKKYLDPVYKIVDYFLGNNNPGYSFVTGFGYRSPQHPHHRVSGSDGIAAPVPGFVVGGSNTSYVDEQDKYEVNEVAINWSAPMVFILGFLIANNDIPTYSQPGDIKKSTLISSKEGIGIKSMGNNLKISFVSHEKTNATIHMFDLAGRLVIKPVTVKVASGPNTYNFNLRNYKVATGTYVLKLKMGRYGKNQLLHVQQR